MYIQRSEEKKDSIPDGKITGVFIAEPSHKDLKLLCYNVTNQQQHQTSVHIQGPALGGEWFWFPVRDDLPHW